MHTVLQAVCHLVTYQSDVIFLPLEPRMSSKAALSLRRIHFVDVHKSFACLLDFPTYCFPYFTSVVIYLFDNRHIPFPGGMS